MNGKARAELPSARMTMPYWLEGESLRRESVLVDGELAWRLFCACADGDESQVRTLLSQDPKLMHAQLWYCKPIDLALRHGHLSVIRTIHEFDSSNSLAFYINRFTTYRCGRPALKRRGHHHILRYLDEEYWPRLVPHHVAELDELAELFPKPWHRDRSIDRQRLVDAVQRNPDLLAGTSKDGRCLVYMALEAWNLELAQQLVELGASTDRLTADRRNLMDTAARWCPAAIPWLRGLGAEPTLLGEIAMGEADAVRRRVTEAPTLLEDSTPLTLAVQRRRADMVAVLVQLGADPNYPGSDSSWGTPLAEAAERNELAMMEMLLDAGANPNAVVDSTGSVYDHLIRWGKRPVEEVQEAVALLVRHGADPVEFGVAESKGMLHFLQHATTEQILAVQEDGTPLSNCSTAQQLDAYVARVGNERIRKGPWYEMCKGPDDIDLLHCAVRYGYDVNLGDWLGRTQLHAAAASGELEYAQALLQLGADPNRVDAHSSATPLGFAARQGQADLVRLLLAHGADAGLPHEDRLAWARPLQSARHYLQNHEFHHSERTSNQGELTGRYTKSSPEQYQEVIAMLSEL